MSYQNYNSYITKNKQAVASAEDITKALSSKFKISGQGFILKKLIDVAKLNNIDIENNQDLHKILSILEFKSLFPLELYGLVSEIIKEIDAFNNSSENQK